MSQRRRLKKTPVFSEHHLTPKSKGGRGKDKKRSPHNKHVAWHILVKDALEDEAADILSYWIRKDSRFFAITKDPLGNSLYKTVQKMNQWLGDGDLKIKVILKRSKIIQFRPLNHQSIPKIVS